MNQGRTIPITAGAAASTFMLFYLMQGLIAADQIDLPDEPKYLDFIGVLSNPPTQETREIDRLVKPPVVDRPETPLPPKDDRLPGDTDVSIGVAPIPPVVTGDGGFDRAGFGLTEGSQIPLVRVQPNYPPRALEMGIEGWVVVEFTVSAQGDVRDPVVIDADPKGTFDRSALQAVSKFKYKPTVIDGRAVPTPGVRFRVVYSLDQD